MKHKINRILYLLVVSSTLLVSCKKDLDVQPRQQIVLETALNSRDNVNAAIIGVYARLKSLRSYGRDLLAVSEALADNASATNKSGRLVNEAQNVQGATFANWQNSYFAIAEINLILAAIPNLNVAPAVTANERNAWNGQLRFLRALFYFDLMRCYAYEPNMGVPGQDRGGVPIMTTTPTTIAAAVGTTPARAQIDSVYALIKRDIDSANRLLINDFVNLYPNLATKVAAQALYARVSLYEKNYVNAKRWCDSVLSTATMAGRLTNVNSYVGGWTSQIHPESIFEVRFANQAENLGVNESLQTTYSTLLRRGNPAVVGGFGDLVPNGVLLGLLGITFSGTAGAPGAITGRSDDVRNLLFEVGSPARGTARIECTKFIGKNGFPNLDNIPLIRLPEIYLIRAEAMGTIGSPVFDLNAARADLVTVKQSRYSNYATTQASADAGISTGTAMVSEILRQRRIEYAMEGYRWFDLKRLGLDDNNILYTDFRFLAQIPVRETDNNPNLVQNFGY
ncbi:MAG: RagB/SusD family nutrient uptake outer membrane protein [Chitinophagaceae bacterium]|nr:RagB/SusD family nutrient uptake outer membrane protein [Chitinophagaceae bacterium]